MALEGPPPEVALAAQETSERVNRSRELKAHEFRFGKRVNSPPQVAVLQVIRADEGIWERVDPTPEQQLKLEVPRSVK